MGIFGGRPGDQPAAPSTDQFLLVALGNPGERYRRTRHNAGFLVADLLGERWGLGRRRKKFNAELAEGRTGPGGPRVTVIWPQTFMNRSGDAAGPARGSLGIGPGRVIALHDEIDIPFGEVRHKQGGGVAGHNGLKSLDRGLGGRDFWRIRIGVGRPEGTDPEIVSRHVLGRFSEDPEEVAALLEAAATETERLIERLAQTDNDEEDRDE